MLGAPRLLALDEPTAELDLETARKLSALILERAREAVVIMTTHLADELSVQAVQMLRVEAGNVAPA
jgi:ABC-type multidrug transport system ATPase subunit